MLSPRGGLENTVFTIMDSNRSKYLAQPSRMPYQTFPGCENDPEIMARGMDQLVAPFAKLPFPDQLPIVKGLRYALNVGACDRRPVVIITGTPEERKKIKESLAPLSWSPEFAGQFVFTESDPVEGQKAITIVQPDEYGVRSTLLAVSATTNDLSVVLTQGLAKFKPWTNDHRQHLARGVRNGIRWRPAVPVEDKQANSATKRLWGG